MKRPSDAVRSYLDKNDELLDRVIAVAVSIGADPQNLSPHNAVLKIEAWVKETKGWQETAKKMGYTSVPRALKARRQTIDTPPPVEPEPMQAVDDGIPVGELILQWEEQTLRWFKSRNDFSTVVTQAKGLLQMEEIEEAAQKGNDDALLASSLITWAFMELAEIGVMDWAKLSVNARDNKLPTSGKPFLTRLRKLGLGVMIKDYKEAVEAVRVN